MPQMSPLMWTSIILIFMFLFFSVLSNNKPLSAPHQETKTFKSKEKSMKW